MPLIACVNCGSGNRKRLTTTRCPRSIGTYNGKLRVVLCRNCGLCFLNPQPSHEEYVEYYTTKNKDRKFELETFYEDKHYQTNSYIKWLIKNTNIPKNASILELGCGKGALLYSLKNEFDFTNLTGLEISPTYAKLAEGANASAKIYNEDVLNNTLPKNSYDVVFALAFLEHMNNPKELLQEIASLLKPGGYAYFVTPDLYGMTFRNKFFKFVHPFYFSKTTTRSLLEQCGFEIVAIEPTPVFDRHTTLLNPENVVAGELHTIARKSPNKRASPICENYRNIAAHFWTKRLRDAPYEFMYKLMYSKYGRPIRLLRKQSLKRQERKGTLGDPHLDYKNYWASRLVRN